LNPDAGTWILHEKLETKAHRIICYVELFNPICLGKEKKYIQTQSWSTFCDDTELIIKGKKPLSWPRN